VTAPARPTELPQPKAVRDLLGTLLGREVEVEIADAWAPLPRDVAAVAEFVDDHLGLRAVALLDLPMAVHAGASIGLLPAAGAREMIETRRPNALVEENLYEVLSVLASVFNTAEAAHVTIATMHPSGADFPGDVVQIVRKLTGRLDLEVDIDGYGSGRLALVLV
jgi:hypothetical protein